MSTTTRARRWGTARLVIGLGCLLMLCWLIYGAVFTRSRHEAVTLALNDGRIGGLTPEESEGLLRQIKWLAQAAGVREEIALNRPPSPAHLSVYTTTPAAYDATHCARRNAVYDAELDAVFIDLGLLKNDEFRSILEASGYGSVLSMNDLPFFRTYLRFIVLHELGHRQLHRRGRGLFDQKRAADDGGRRIEDEADQFALSAMQAAYKADDESGGAFALKGASDFLGLQEGESGSPGQRVWADLISMASAMNVFDLFLQNQYAPFYEDRAHPTFLHRARSLIAQALRQPGLEQELRVRFDFFDKFLKREAGVLSEPLTEVIAAEPIEGISFDDGGLVITSRGLKSLSRVPYAEVTSPGAGAKSVSLPPTAAGAGFDEDRVSVWGGPAGGPLAFGGVETYVGSGSLWEKRETDIAKALAGQTAPHVFMPPQPSRIALAVSSTTDDARQERWYALRDGSVARMKSAAEIASEIAARGGPSGCNLEANTVTEQRFYLAAEKCSAPTDAKWLGVAVLDADTLDVLRFVSLDLPEGLPEDEGRRLVVAPAGDTERFILVSPDGGPRPVGWVAWLLSPGGAPQILARQPYLINEAHADDSLRSEFGTDVSFTAWVPGDYVLVGCNADSVYLLNLKSNTARVLFHPGDELLKISVNRDGLVAVYMRGGYKCYLMRPHGARA